MRNAPKCGQNAQIVCTQLHRLQSEFNGRLNTAKFAAVQMKFTKMPSKFNSHSDWNALKCSVNAKSLYRWIRKWVPHRISPLLDLTDLNMFDISHACVFDLLLIVSFVTNFEFSLYLNLTDVDSSTVQATPSTSTSDAGLCYTKGCNRTGRPNLSQFNSEFVYLEIISFLTNSKDESGDHSIFSTSSLYLSKPGGSRSEVVRRGASWRFLSWTRETEWLSLSEFPAPSLTSSEPEKTSEGVRTIAVCARMCFAVHNHFLISPKTTVPSKFISMDLLVVGAKELGTRSFFHSVG